MPRPLRRVLHRAVAIPGMPHGKPAGIPCVQLDDDYRCRLFGKPERPAFCASLRPQREMCGDSRKDAMRFLLELERMTRPCEEMAGLS